MQQESFAKNNRACIVVRMSKKVKKKPSVISPSSAPENPILAPSLSSEPNVAFRTVRESLGKTQSQMAGALELSVPLIQAIESGQREITPDVARRMRNRFGVFPGSLRAGSKTPFDLTGTPFSDASTTQVFSNQPQVLGEDDQESFAKPTVYLAKAAARAGKLLPFGAAFREKIIELLREFDLKSDLDAVLAQVAEESRTQVVTREWLRKHPELIKLFKYVDDPSKPGSQEVRLLAQVENAPIRAPLFPDSRWIPDTGILEEKMRKSILPDNASPGKKV